MRRTSSAEMLRWNSSNSFRRRMVFQTASTSMARVTVFIPPAVLAGLPPTIISPHISSLPAGERAAISMVLNPAVRAVTDWNRRLAQADPAAGQPFEEPETAGPQGDQQGGGGQGHPGMQVEPGAGEVAAVQRHRPARPVPAPDQRADGLPAVAQHREADAAEDDQRGEDTEDLPVVVQRPDPAFGRAVHQAAAVEREAGVAEGGDAVEDGLPDAHPGARAAGPRRPVPPENMG